MVVEVDAMVARLGRHGYSCRRACRRRGPGNRSCCPRPCGEAAAVYLGVEVGTYGVVQMG